jgi:hypothetical protein
LKDLEDTQAIAANHPNLDKECIRFWVETFGEALETSGFWKNIQELL